MSLKLVNVPEGLCDYPSQPRSFKPAGYIESLAANIEANGQQVPVIGWTANGRYQLGDGGCRLDAIRLHGLMLVLGIDLGQEPSRLELLVAQASIDLHKQHLPPVDRARLYQSIQAEKGSNGKETAEAVGISASLLSRYLPLVNLAPDLQVLVNSGQLEWTKGSLIAQATADHDQQRQMAKEAQAMTRDGLAAKLRKPCNGSTAGVKVNRLKIELSSVTLTVAGKGLTHDAAIAATTEAQRIMEKGRREGLSAKTIQKISADRAGKNGGIEP